MQTFLPYPDFALSAKVLDLRRLGKQRVECLQITNTLLGISDGWANHPVMTMWRGYESSLLRYGYAICKEWVGRGHSDNVLYQLEILEKQIKIPNPSEPPWFGDVEFHLSHQSNLLRKAEWWYAQYFAPTTPRNLPYIWPNPYSYLLKD